MPCKEWLLMPWSQFTKRAFPGSSRAVFGRIFAVLRGTRWDPDRVSFIFFTPRGPRVPFNSNLKVTRAPAINKPRMKPVNCPAGARLGPCRDPPGTRGQNMKESTQGTRPDHLRYPGGVLCVPDSACRDPAGVLSVLLRCPNGSRSGPLNNLQGVHSYWDTSWSMFNKSIPK